MITQLETFSNTTEGWQRSLYAFLAETEQRSGSRHTVEGYSRMLQDFFGRVGKQPDKKHPRISFSMPTVLESPLNNLQRLL